MSFQRKSRWNRGPSGTTGNRAGLTFREIVEQNRLPSAQRAWNRACVASRLRHLAVTQGRRASAAVLGRLKIQAVMRAVELCPEKVGLSIDDDFQIGLPTAEWRGRGRLHLPSRCPVLTDAKSAA